MCKCENAIVSELVCVLMWSMHCLHETGIHDIFGPGTMNVKGQKAGHRDKQTQVSLQIESYPTQQTARASSTGSVSAVSRSNAMPLDASSWLPQSAVAT